MLDILTAAQVGNVLVHRLRPIATAIQSVASLEIVATTLMKFAQVCCYFPLCISIDHKMKLSNVDG